jgi:hypothetical protein
MAIELFGFLAVASMVTMYALELARLRPRVRSVLRRGVAPCHLIHSWPFAAGVGVWAVIALRRWVRVRPRVAS